MPASASATEIAADLADLEDLLAKAQRPKVRTILQEYIASLRAEQATLGGATKAAPPAAPAPGPLSGLKDENKKPAAEPKKETQASLFGAAPAAPELEKAPASAKKQPGATLFHSAEEVPAAAIDPATYGGSGHVRPQTDTAAAIAKLASGLAEGMHTHTPAPAPAPVKLPTNISANAGGASAITWTNISSFGWDQDTYGKDPNFVYVYIMSGVDGVGDIKEKVSCEFTASAFDLKIVGLNGKNYRLLKNGLEKEIVPESSKFIVKKNRITIKMSKAKGQYGYDNWMELTGKAKKVDPDTGKEKEPGAALMDMMKDMYDNGDDNLRKTLGEAMLKSKQNEAMGKSVADDDFDTDKY